MPDAEVQPAPERVDMEEWCALKMESVREEWGWSCPAAWMLEALTDDELLAYIDCRRVRRARSEPA